MNPVEQGHVCTCRQDEMNPVEQGHVCTCRQDELNPVEQGHVCTCRQDELIVCRLPGEGGVPTYNSAGQTQGARGHTSPYA
jgi:hypothetical protein